MEKTSRSAGEIDEILQDIRKESKTMMKDLMEVDNILVSLKDKIENDHFDKEEFLKEIEGIRSMIGSLEKEDVQEENYEEIADNLIKKLKKWINLIV